MKSVLPFVALPLLMLAACAPKPTAPVDSGAVLNDVRKVEADQIAAINAGNAAAATAVYSDDAVVVTPGNPVMDSPQAIRNGADEMAKDHNTALVITPGKGWVSANGDMAVTTGTVKYTFTDPATGQPKTVDGANQSLWRKQGDGSWKLVADFNAEIPPANPAPAETPAAK
ncbi:MAG: SgcJ/EcaC family oxidoreductase [Alphaproteobacteria bacterium]|nr:SgcJ/EcaC family oxidoreductase [Alphaproteobacteria bacterium]